MDLKSSHEASIDIILDEKCQSIAKNQSIFVINAGTVTQIQDQEEAAAGIKGAKACAIHSRHEVVKQNRILPDGINPYLLEGPVLKINAVPAAEDLGVPGALKKPVHPQTAVGAGRQPRFGE